MTEQTAWLRPDPHALASWAAAFFLAASLFSHTVALRLLLLVFGVALCAWTLAKRRDALRALPPIWLALTLWTAWAALSIAWSADPLRSEKEFRNEFVYTAFAFWMCYVGAQAPDALRRVFPVVAAAAVLASAIALYYFPRGPVAYAYGWHGGAGNHSSALLVLMPCAAMTAWYALRARLPRVVPLAAGAFALLLAVSAYTTLNRTVWLGFVIEFLVLLALIVVSKKNGWKVQTKVFAASLATLIVVSAAAMTWVVHSERVIEGTAYSASDPRPLIWTQTLELIEARPATGYGVGRGLLRRSLTDEIGEKFAWHAHNLFLDVTLQTGIPGLVLLLLLLGTTLREAWRLTREEHDLAAACGMALAAVVAGMLVRNMTDNLWVRQNSLLYWGVVGTLLGAGISRRTPTAQR